MEHELLAQGRGEAVARARGVHQLLAYVIHQSIELEYRYRTDTHCRNATFRHHPTTRPRATPKDHSDIPSFDDALEAKKLDNQNVFQTYKEKDDE